MSGVPLPVATQTKFLGVWLDSTLNWNVHFGELTLKLAKGQHLLKCCKNIFSMQTKINIYYAHVYSHLVYGITIWGNILSKEKLKKLQNIMQCKNYTWVTRGTKMRNKKMRNKNVEQKLPNKNCGTKNGGDHWTLGAGDLKCKCKKVSRTKMWNKNWWGLLDIGCWGPQVEVQKRSAEQKCRTKISGDPFALVLRVPITQCPMVPTNFYSAVFVPHFCSADLFALALEVPNTQCPRVPTNFCSCNFCSAFLFH